VSDNQIRVAVIGAGNMGKNHLRTYKAMDGVELVALADISPTAKKLAKEYGVKYYENYIDLLEEEKPDAVSVVVPTPLHYKLGKEIMGKGIHCLIEKPIASSPEEADELIILAKKQKVIFTVGHIERYNPMILKLKKLVDTLEIGEITSVVVRRVGGFPNIEPKTDVIIDLAVHDIEIMSFLLGKQPKNIHGHGSRTLHSKNIDSAEIFLDFGVASGFIQANWITPVKIRTIAVTGTKGYVEGNYITQELTYFLHNIKKQNDGFKNFVVTMGEPQKRYVSESLEEPLKNELTQFIASIKEGKPTEILVKPEAARSALDVALKALGKSSKEKK
jgi:UDP-N-acetylglucosamine 3-dehydrogenase